jgi:hypothetical protein
MKVLRKGSAGDVLESIVHVDNTNSNKQCILRLILHNLYNPATDFAFDFHLL